MPTPPRVQLVLVEVFLGFSVLILLFTLYSIRPDILETENVQVGDELAVIAQDKTGAAEAGSQLHNKSPWASRSAFLPIMALCFGYFVQPRGSNLFPRCGRAWRLSPLFALADTASIG